MDFHLEFTPKPFAEKIRHSDKLFLAGSCFTEQVGNKLAAHKFRIVQNPHGILFNPVSLANSISSYVHKKIYKEEDLFFQNELWGSWNHHTRFSSPDINECLQKINQAQQEAIDFLPGGNWLVLTLGSAFIYEMENGMVVANCHKVPTDKFHKKLLTVTETTAVLSNLLNMLHKEFPMLKVIFTISPVRHIRDGFIENNRSKATLLNAVHDVVDAAENTLYFPSYELIIDDLRDYRFYAEDMVHPNYAATNYVWEKFKIACIDSQSIELMEDINSINAARSHKAFNPSSNAHKKFLKKNLEKIHQIQQEHSYINFEEETSYFNS